MNRILSIVLGLVLAVGLLISTPAAPAEAHGTNWSCKVKTDNGSQRWGFRSRYYTGVSWYTIYHTVKYRKCRHVKGWEHFHHIASYYGVKRHGQCKGMRALYLNPGNIAGYNFPTRRFNACQPKGVEVVISDRNPTNRAQNAFDDITYGMSVRVDRRAQRDVNIKMPVIGMN